MPKNPLVAIQTQIDVAFTELGCKIPVTIENEELIVRDLIVFKDEDEIIGLEAANPETPLFRLPENSITDIAALIAIHICKGVITRALSRNSF
jgi:hypothetical protein